MVRPQPGGDPLAISECYWHSALCLSYGYGRDNYNTTSNNCTYWVRHEDIMREPISWTNEKRMIAELKPATYNPRQATEKDESDLAISIDRFSLADPIIINRNNTVIGGHFRLRMLERKGISECDVRVPNRLLDQVEEQELNLRLNKNQGSWNFDLLKDFGKDMLSDVGFESMDMDRIFPEVKEDNFDTEAEYQAITQPVAKLGDIFQLGNHRLMCGDSTIPSDISKLMSGSKAKLCFTSPPYNMAAGLYRNYKDDLPSQEYIEFNLRVIINVQSIVNGFIFWNVSYNKNARWEFLEILHRIVKETNFKFLELIVWDKGHGIPISSDNALTRRYEDILLIGEESAVQRDLELFCLASSEKKAYFNKTTQKGITNYWHISSNKSQIAELKACFPMALPSKAILLMTQVGDVVIDPFGGSGSTLMSCEQLERSAYLMELDPKYVDVIIKRWETFTGKKAICIGNN